VPITAEGVESEQIRSALAGFGCSEAQGWLFGRPISAEAVRSFLAMSFGSEPAPAAEPAKIPKAEAQSPRARTNRRW
jgi:predicted signal transduction protein with EAL and GGDEF domain